jgi:peptidyl-dipeptidase A
MTTNDFGSFRDAHLREVEPLAREVNLAYWDAAVSGKPEDFERSAELQIQLQRIYSRQDDFESIVRWRDSKAVSDPLDRRQLDLLYYAYLRNQIDPALNEEITKLASSIESQFNVYRAKIDGRTATSNDILRILKESDDSELRRKAWNAAKAVGAMVHDDLIKLVKLRNEAATSIEYDNYYEMSLDLGEQNEAEIIQIFNDLEVQTREPFASMKRETDERLASRFSIKPADIRPWHYEDPFFQEAPRVFDVDLDHYYAGQDIVDIALRFYQGIGLDVSDILARSDLYERAGKDQHAFCTDIDRKGDIRILANIKHGEIWVGTMLHELGHAVHDKYLDASLPYLLRREAHIFTTEAIAMFFGRLSKDADWIQDMIGMPDEERARIDGDLTKSVRLHQLIFSRWSQVMMRFERELYLDPDRDLNRLWWDLVATYQLITPPEDADFPHWASKSHIVSAPVYYHNYLLGELLASQLCRHIEDNVIEGKSGTHAYNGSTTVGDFLRKNIFEPGARYRWDDMIRRATGADLSPEHFVREFVDD